MTFAKITYKEELLEYFQNDEIPKFIDSEISNQTRDLVKLFGATGVDMNRWWVMTPPNWSCPCCSRVKSQIVRLNKHGYLTCHLHEHHDHMADLIGKIFNAASAKLEPPIADNKAKKFVIRTAFALSAYDNTVICADCNEADAIGKAAAKTHHDFSFSPSEISSFIITENNKKHTIDENLAQKAWLSSKESFEIRLKMARQIVEIAIHNAHWYQPSENTAKNIENIAKNHFQFIGLYNISDEPEKLLYTTMVHKGTRDSWRKNRHPTPGQAPTRGEILHMSNTNGNYWNREPEAWICPCCKRSKIDCVRKSNKGTWSFEVKVTYLFDEIEKKPYSTSLCNDCHTTTYHAGNEFDINDTLEYKQSVITLQEAQGMIESHKNSKHRISNGAVEKLGEAITQRIALGYGALRNH